MKKRKTILYFIAISTVIALMITGCNNVNTENTTQPPTIPGTPTTGPSSSPNQGITVNFIDFEIVDPTSLDTEKQASIESLSKKTGYYYWMDENSTYTILISLGMRSTSGYDIDVQSVEDNEGNTNIVVVETEPDKDAMVAQVITYPYVIIEASGITDRFNIKDTNEAIYNKLDSGLIGSQMIICQYVGLIDNTSIEVLVDGQPMVFRNNNMVSLAANIDDGVIVKIVYHMNDQDQRILESITPADDEVSATLSATGIYQGLIDGTSLEIKIDDTFMSLRNNNAISMTLGLEPGDSVAFLYMISSDGHIFLVNIEPLI